MDSTRRRRRAPRRIFEVRAVFPQTVADSVGESGRLGPWYLIGLEWPQRQTIASPGRSVMFMDEIAELRSPVTGPSNT